MKRLFLIIALIIGASNLAYAQGQQQCFTTNDDNCIKVGNAASGSNKPLPVQIISSATLTITQSGLTNVNIADVNGAVPSLTNPLNVSAGDSGQFSSTPVIQASAYAATTCLGGFNAVTVTDINGQSGFVTNFRIASIGGLTPTITLYIFDSNPSASTCTDKSTFTLNSADVDKLIAAPTPITLAAPTGTSSSFGSVDFIPPRPFKAGGSATSGVKTIYYGLVTTAITPASTTDIHTRVGTALN